MSGRGECMGLTIRTKKECRWDLVSLGEVMVRFDPGDRRIATARAFEVCEGGVDQSLVRWVEHDGVGRAARNGLNFTERGFGVRAAVGSYDRGHTAVSQLKPGDINWNEIFGKHGARWFHTGGIFCALSETTPEVTLEAIEAARRNGTVVSYDLNYRASLWKSHGGKKQAQDVNRSEERRVGKECRSRWSPYH